MYCAWAFPPLASIQHAPALSGLWALQPGAVAPKIDPTKLAEHYRNFDLGFRKKL